MVNLYKDPDGKTVFPFKPSTNAASSHQNSDYQEHAVDVRTVKSLKTKIAELEAALSEMSQVA